jgi:hypothetical protein
VQSTATRTATPHRRLDHQKKRSWRSLTLTGLDFRSTSKVTSCTQAVTFTRRPRRWREDVLIAKRWPVETDSASGGQADDERRGWPFPGPGQSALAWGPNQNGAARPPSARSLVRLEAGRPRKPLQRLSAIWITQPPDDCGVAPAPNYGSESLNTRLPPPLPPLPQHVPAMK